MIDIVRGGWKIRGIEEWSPVIWEAKDADEMAPLSRVYFDLPLWRQIQQGRKKRGYYSAQWIHCTGQLSIASWIFSSGAPVGLMTSEMLSSFN